MQKIIKIIIVFFFIFILGVLYFSLNKSNQYDTKYLVGNKIDKIQLETFNDENYFTNEIFEKNNFTLINFWASWCGPCKIEHPFLMKLSKEKNLNILGVNFKDKENNAMKFLNDLGNPYTYLAKDYLGKQSINFGIYGIPESILVNNEFIILKKYIGPLSESDFEEIKKIINLL